MLLSKQALSAFTCINGSVAQWITRLTTNQEIAGSSPARLEIFFFSEVVNLFFQKWLSICNRTTIFQIYTFKSVKNQFLKDKISSFTFK